VDDFSLTFESSIQNKSDMKTLKLQMQVSIDGFVAGPEGQLDWMSIDHDSKALDFINHLTDTSDTIIMGRKMSPGFLEYWEAVVDQKISSPEYPFAKKMVDLPKIIFSKTQKTTTGRNARVENGNLKEEILKLKNQPGKDIIVYGGAEFVSNLIEQDLIDEYYLFVNPTAIGKGLRIFKGNVKMKLVDSTSYSSGLVINHYKRIK
jgi:dihydrofolate reductase